MDPAVSDNPDKRRYEITADGELAGFAVYGRKGGLIAFTHTEIDSRFEGRGLGSKLVGSALEDAREKGQRILPFCPFVSSYIERHPEYLDLVPEEHRAEFGL